MFKAYDSCRFVSVTCVAKNGPWIELLSVNWWFVVFYSCLLL